MPVSWEKAQVDLITRIGEQSTKLKTIGKESDRPKIEMLKAAISALATTDAETEKKIILQKVNMNIKLISNYEGSHTAALINEVEKMLYWKWYVTHHPLTKPCSQPVFSADDQSIRHLQKEITKQLVEVGGKTGVKYDHKYIVLVLAQCVLHGEASPEDIKSATAHYTHFKDAIGDSRTEKLINDVFAVLVPKTMLEKITGQLAEAKLKPGTTSFHKAVVLSCAISVLKGEKNHDELKQAIEQYPRFKEASDGTEALINSVLEMEPVSNNPTRQQ